MVAGRGAAGRFKTALGSFSETAVAPRVILAHALDTTPALDMGLRLGECSAAGSRSHSLRAAAGGGAHRRANPLEEAPRRIVA